VDLWTFSHILWCQLGGCHGLSRTRELRGFISTLLSSFGHRFLFFVLVLGNSFLFVWLLCFLMCCVFYERHVYTILKT
jgi:hypothetical protein